MKDFFVLKLLDRFRYLFIKSGVNYPLMRKILQVKLTMDGRRVPTVINREEKRKEKTNNFAYSLILYVVYSVILIPFILAGENYIYQMSIVFAIFILIMMLSLISDFSAVLLDVRDKNILLPRPVDHKTRNTAKIMHICTYLFCLTAALTALPLIAALAKRGILFSLIFLAEIILADLFIVVVTGLVCLLILRFFDGEKLKDIINSVQIILALATAVGYQFVGQLFGITLQGVHFTPKWWQFFAVPVWFGAPFEVLLKGDRSIFYLLFSALAIVVPAVCIVIYVKSIPSFERNLQKLNNHSGQKKRSNPTSLERVARVLCRSKEEQAFFKFAANLIKSERELKLKIYPSIGLTLALPLIFLLRMSSIEELGHAAGSKWFFAIYYCGLTLPVMIQTMKYSVNYKGAWIYKACPVQNMASIHKGTLKAVFFRLFVPIYLIESIAFTVIFGLGSLPRLIAVFFNIILFTIISYRVINPELPFSEAAGATKGGGLIVFLLLLVLTALAGIHLFCTQIYFGNYIDMAVVTAAGMFLWKRTFNGQTLQVQQVK